MFNFSPIAWTIALLNPGGVPMDSNQYQNLSQSSIELTSEPFKDKNLPNN